MSARTNDNYNEQFDNIIFDIKDTKLNVPVVTLSANNNQKLSRLHNQQKVIKTYINLFAKDSKVQSFGMNVNQKVKLNLQEITIAIFLNQTLLVLTNYLFYSNQNNNEKRYKAKNVLFVEA